MIFLQKAIGYTFKDQQLLTLALTHKSKKSQKLQNEHGRNNERLEFLGDAVLSLITAEYLYKEKSSLKEGELSKSRAEYVCKDFLYKKALNINLNKYIISDNSMRQSGSNSSPSILADTLEAIIGAVFIDGGLEIARETVFKVLGKPLLKVLEKPKDAKTLLQEKIQAQGLSTPKYEVLNASGPAHSPNFIIAVTVDGKILATSEGESKKSAAQNAAQKALEALEKS